MYIRSYFVVLFLFLWPFTNAAIAQNEWSVTCEIAERLAVSCDGVPPPPIIPAEFTDQRKGFVVDEIVRDGVIFIRHDLRQGTLRRSVLVHAMIHYLLDYKGIVSLGESRELTCRSEGYAFAASNEFLKSEGRRDLVNRRWWKSYKGCTSKHSKISVNENQIVNAAE